MRAASFAYALAVVALITHHGLSCDDHEPFVDKTTKQPSSFPTKWLTALGSARGFRLKRQANDAADEATTTAATTAATTTTAAPTVPPKAAETNFNGLMLPQVDNDSSVSNMGIQSPLLLNAALAQICYNLTMQQQHQPGYVPAVNTLTTNDPSMTKDGYIVAAPIESLMPNISYDGTQVAAFNEFPFYATVFATSNRQTGTLCGGAFIDKRTVVTAASCFFDSKDKKYTEVRVTDGSSAELIAPRYTTWMSVSQTVVTHPQYSKAIENIRYNLAVINLVVAASNVGTLPLGRMNSIDMLYPMQSQNQHQYKVLGFGRVNPSTPQMYLRYQNVQPYGADVCAMVYGDAICSATVLSGRNSATGRSALCNVESGAPLFRAINNQGDLRLFGIGSFIPKRGCTDGALDGFTNVSYFRDWIVGNSQYNPSVSEVVSRPQPVETFTYTPWGMSF